MGERAGWKPSVICVCAMDIPGRSLRGPQVYSVFVGEALPFTSARLLQKVRNSTSLTFLGAFVSLGERL